MAPSSTPPIAFPLAMGDDRRTALVPDVGAAVAQLIEQLALTRPGERLNQPKLGCGVGDLVFGALSAELAAATQFTVSGELQEYLGDVLRVLSVEVTARDSRLDLAVTYALKPSGSIQTVTVTR